MPEQQEYTNIPNQIREFLVILLTSIEVGGNTVTFRDQDVEELRNLLNRPLQRNA